MGHGLREGGKSWDLAEQVDSTVEEMLSRQYIRFCPTDAWKPARSLWDVYHVPIEVEGARQPYRLALGFYDWRTGERLPAFALDGSRLLDDQFLLAPR